jgi:small subunit ribosomal protein S4
MGRYTGPKEKLSRREGVNLFLKGARSSSDKAGINRRPFPPGQHGNKSRVRLSNYGRQLREKQKVKRVYGLRERQFKNLYTKADRISKKDNTDKGLELLKLLELRLDNVVYLSGLAVSRGAARQFVNHGHVEVNGSVVSIPSYILQKDDEVKLKKENLLPIETFVKVPRWLEKNKTVVKVIDLPIRDDVDEGIKENLIIEFYSR